MVAWFIDIFVAYLFRVIVRMIKARGSGAWPIETATVISSDCPYARYACDVAVVTYNYRVAGEFYAGVNEKPFIVHRSAEDYVRDFAPGTEFPVRVKPGDPWVSIVARKR